METAAKVRPAKKKNAASPGPRSPEEEEEQKFETIRLTDPGASAA